MSAERRAAAVSVGQSASVLEVLDDEAALGTPLLETGVNPIVVSAPSVPGAPESSDLCLTRRGAEDARAAAEAVAAVTLFVYGWHQVEPGALSWVFPSVRAALDAVRTMRNAVEWCICSGESWEDVESARASGAVLIEQLG